MQVTQEDVQRINKLIYHTGRQCGELIGFKYYVKQCTYTKIVIYNNVTFYIFILASDDYMMLTPKDIAINGEVSCIENDGDQINAMMTVGEFSSIYCLSQKIMELLPIFEALGEVKWHKIGPFPAVMHSLISLHMGQKSLLMVFGESIVLLMGNTIHYIHGDIIIDMARGILRTYVLLNEEGRLTVIKREPHIEVLYHPKDRHLQQRIRMCCCHRRKFSYTKHNLAWYAAHGLISDSWSAQSLAEFHPASCECCADLVRAFSLPNVPILTDERV